MRAGQARRDSLFAEEIAGCRRCPRLADYCESFSLPENRKGEWTDYWARPVPGFGDRNAELLIIGLAPGAHGANRTGRPFTGDAAGVVLYRALHAHGFGNRAEVSARGDGLRLRNVYITNAVKCVPPANRPTTEEKRSCLDWLRREVEQLGHLRVVLAMGRDAFQAYLSLLKAAGIVRTLSAATFGHGKVHHSPGESRVLLASYHFSRYNINTGRLTETMVDDLFGTVRGLLEGAAER